MGREVDSFLNGLLVGIFRYWVDVNLLGWHLYLRSPFTKTLRVLQVSLIQRSLSHLGDLKIFTSEHLLWRKACKRTVVMIVVVSFDVIFAPAHGVIVVVKAPRIVRLVL